MSEQMGPEELLDAIRARAAKAVAEPMSAHQAKLDAVRMFQDLDVLLSEGARLPSDWERRTPLRRIENELRDVLRRALWCDSCGRPLLERGCQSERLADGTHWIHVVKGGAE
jgi:hypothetical protein